MKFTLTLILFITGITAMLSGLAMMSSPEGNLLNLHYGILKNTPFKDFQIPGFLLFATVGATNIIAVFYQMMEHQIRFKWSLIAGVTTIGWFIAQYLFVGHFLMLDIVYLLAGLSVVFVSVKQRGKSLI